MDKLEFTLLLLIGTLWNALRIGSCIFGENCDYPCHCLDNAVCNPLNGSCPFGCDDGNLRESEDYWYTGAWSGYGCQIGNVAYDKSANQSMTLVEGRDAGLAVDGNHNPNLTEGHCAHPGFVGGPVPAWWQVDLGSTYVVSSINITNRGDCCSYRTTYLNIFVSDAEGDASMTNLCHSVGTEGRAANTYISCTRLMVGRYVILTRQTRFEPHLMNICEVQVYGYLHQDCPDDHFGVACGIPCNCHCDDLVGECKGPCHGGWTGSNCQTPCDDGEWGSDCVERCHCRDEATCDRSNGQCPSGCNQEYGGSSCNLVLPVFNSVIELSSASSTTLDISFVPWNSARDTVYIPAGYEVQRRVNGSTVWITGIEIQHSIDIDTNTAMLRNLEPDTAYYIRIVTFIVEGDMRYYSFVLQESGPFQTNEADKGVSGFPVAMAAGITVGLIVMVASVVVVGLLTRRHMLRGNASRQSPVVVLDSTQPGLYEDVGPGGQENCAYEDIVEYPKENDEIIYYNTAPTTVDNIIQSSKGIKDIHVNEDIILHDLSPTSLASGDEESGYQKLLGRPIEVDEVPLFAEELHSRNSGFTEELLDQYANMNSNAFLDALQADETSVPSSDIETRYPELQQPTSESGLSTIQGQYVLLQCSKPSRKPKTKTHALHKENLPKNRDSASVPSNKYRAQLTTLIDGRNDYINAVLVDGYRNRRAYIATQLPMPDTVVDFWSLVYDHKCRCIVALQQPDPEDESTPVYWPTTTETVMDFELLRVTLVDEEILDQGAINMMEFEITISNKESHNVRLYQFLTWPGDAKTPLNMENLLMLLNRAHRLQLRSVLGPLCFICKFGYERCGLMIAACHMLERLRAEGEVDVFQAVKQVRIARPEFVTSLTQYEFLYELAIAYINFQDYVNFK